MPADTAGRFEFDYPQEQTFIVVGLDAPLAKLRRLAERFGLPLRRLEAVQSAPSQDIRFVETRRGRT